MTLHIKVTSDNINITDMIAKIQSPDHGAIDIFIGAVRNHHDGKTVTGITYDAHESLVEKTFERICREAEGLWPDTHYALEHYKGALPVGGISIAIAVSAAHRAESFEACRYVIEEVKKQAPVWKQEHYQDSKSEWLPGHSLRHEAAHSETCCGKCCGGKYA